MSKFCAQCKSTVSSRWYKGPSCRNCYRRLKYAEDSTNRRDSNSKSYQQNKEDRIKTVNEWTSKNQDKVKSYKVKHYKNNKAAFRANKARYRASRLQATPKWADLKAIREFYANCPAGYHVDHIIPLRGKDICGLHVLENLQYLPAFENLSKNNKFQIPEVE